MNEQESWEKDIRNASDFHTEAPVVHASNVRALLTSRETYWKERVRKEIDGELERYKDRDDFGAQFCRSALQDVREKICILPLQH